MFLVDIYHGYNGGFIREGHDLEDLLEAVILDRDGVQVGPVLGAVDEQGGPAVRYIQALLSLVELLHYCALIGRELHSVATPALLYNKEPAKGKKCPHGSCVFMV